MAWRGAAAVALRLELEDTASDQYPCGSAVGSRRVASSHFPRRFLLEDRERDAGEVAGSPDRTAMQACWARAGGGQGDGTEQNGSGLEWDSFVVFFTG